MSDQNPASDPGQRDSSLYDAIRFVTVTGTLVILLGIAYYLVNGAFDLGGYAGIRSLSAFLLPLIIASFAFLFRRSWLDALLSCPLWLAFGGSFVAGVAIMVALRNLDMIRGVPVAELLVGACVSVLAFSPGSLHGLTLARSEHGDKALAYYFGVVVGMLVYVVLFGFPVSGGA